MADKSPDLGVLDDANEAADEAADVQPVIPGADGLGIGSYLAVKSAGPKRTLQDFSLQTLEGCRDVLESALYCLLSDELELNVVKVVGDLAKKAADTLIKESKPDTEAMELLKKIASSQPSARAPMTEEGGSVFNVSLAGEKETAH